MNAPHEKSIDKRLDAYLDGTLVGSELQEFEQQVASDASLRNEVRCQEKLDGYLRTRFLPPPPPPLPLPWGDSGGSPDQSADSSFHHNADSHIQDSPSEIADVDASIICDTPLTDASTSSLLSQTSAKAIAGPTGGRGMQVGDLAPWLATPAARAVAALTLAILAVCLLIRALWPDGDGRYAGRDTKPLGAAYQELIGQGFVAYDQRTAEWEANADLFRDTMYARHGEPLRWSQALPSDIELVGLVYAPSISRHSTAILARVDNRPVVLFVDDRERDGGAASAGSLTNLNVFRQEHGRLVIYEVTPWDEPRLSLLLEPTDPPPDMCLEE